MWLQERHSPLCLCFLICKVEITPLHEHLWEINEFEKVKCLAQYLVHMWHWNVYVFLLCLYALFLQYLHCALQIVCSSQKLQMQALMQALMQNIAAHPPSVLGVILFLHQEAFPNILAKQGHFKRLFLLTYCCNRPNWAGNNSGLPWWQKSGKHPRGTVTISNL